MSIYTTHTREAILLISTLGLFCTAPSCVDNPEPVPPTPPSGGTAGTGGAPTGGVAPVTGGTAGTGGRASEAERVCQRLSDLGCPEGDNPDCVAGVELIQNDDRFSMDAECILNATTKVEVQGCENVACGGVK